MMLPGTASDGRMVQVAMRGLYSAAARTGRRRIMQGCDALDGFVQARRSLALGSASP
jgi:hypothetical protein